jgi:hypothetical protein
MTYQNVPDEPEPHSVYGYMERQVAFKLLAAHALADAEFFDELRRDPEAAAAQLHIRLTDRDIDYLNNSVEWDRIAQQADEIRDSLKLDLVTNSW